MERASQRQVMDQYWLPSSGTVIESEAQVVQGASKSKEADLSLTTQPIVANFANIFASAASSATGNSDMLGLNGKNFMVGHGMPSLNQITIPSANQLSKRTGVFPIAGTLPGMATISNIGLANGNVIIAGNAAQLNVDNQQPVSASQITFASAPQMAIAVSKDFIQQTAAETGVTLAMSNNLPTQIYTLQQQDSAPSLSSSLTTEQITATLSAEAETTLEKALKCSECDKAFKETSQLSYHVLVAHSQAQVRPHRCAACPETFLETRQLQDHIKAVHTLPENQNESTYTCGECNVTFTNGSSLSYHLYMAHTAQGSSTMQHLCTECGKSFLKPNILSAHIKNVHGTKPGFSSPSQACVESSIHVQTTKQFPCPNCEKVFKLPLYLKQHMLSAHDKPHKCEECGKGFGRRSDLNRHMRGVHMRERPHRCNKCGWTFAEAGNLKHHLQAVHSKVKNYRCPVCSRSFSLATYLKTHMVRVHGLVENSKTSGTAGVTTVNNHTAALVLSHATSQNTQNNVNNLQITAVAQSQVSRCFECGQVFANASMLQHHVISSHAQPFWCTVCGEGFSQAFQLQTHLQLRHRNPNEGLTIVTPAQNNQNVTTMDLNQVVNVSAQAIQAEKCSDCEMILEKGSKQQHICTSNLNKFHQVALTAAMAVAVERPHLCTKCGKGFKTATHLRQHVRCVHTKDRPHKCQECPKTFARMSDLNRHIRGVHERIKPPAKALRLVKSKCNNCGSMFPDPIQLKRHVLTVHLHQCPSYKCADCQEGFPDEQSFKDHICHEEARPHMCTICTKRFAETTQLRRHIRSAHGQQASQQQHKCFECRRQFTRPVDLDRHIRAVHRKEKPHKCAYCGKYFGLHGNLNKHIRAVHMHEKPHQCVECGKCFAHIGVLKRHLRDIHFYDRRPAHNNPRLKNTSNNTVTTCPENQQQPVQQQHEDQQDSHEQGVTHMAVLQAIEAMQQQDQQQLVQQVQLQQEPNGQHIARIQLVQSSAQPLSENVVAPPHSTL